jgi:hypothetical protein
MIHHDTKQIVPGADATYDQTLNWKSIHTLLTWRTQSTEPGSTTGTPALSVAVASGGEFSVGLLIDEGPVAQISITVASGTTAGDVFDAVVEKIDEINAMDLGPRIVVVGRPLLPDESVSDATTSGGTADSVAGSMGTLLIELVGAEGSVITLVGEACVTTDNWLHVSEAVFASLGRGEIIRTADSQRRALHRS